jgi:hypothetical protein
MGFENHPHERPFLVGQFVGVRSFSVGGGVLGAISQSYQFKDGENQAHCPWHSTNDFPNFRGRQADQRADRIRNRVKQYGDYLAEYDRNWLRKYDEVQQVESVQDLVGSRDCSCGFYGYYSTYYNSYASPQTVTGIVHAYGTVSFSNRGFRASKLKIVALVNPNLAVEAKSPGPLKWLSTRPRSWWYRSLTTFTAVTFIVSVLNIVIQRDWSTWMFVGTSLCTAFWVGLSMFMDWFRSRQTDQSRHGAVSKSIPQRDWQKLRENYPSVKWYPNAASAMRDFPLTKYKHVKSL